MLTKFGLQPNRGAGGRRETGQRAHSSNALRVDRTSSIGKQPDSAEKHNDMDSFAKVPPRERPSARTPMHCPICDLPVVDVQIRDIGGLTADLFWQVHAGRCPVHGWFQAELVAQPPREIFPVDRPFGIARRVLVGNEEIYAFATVWNDVPPERKRSHVDPLDPQYWRVRSLKISAI